MPWTVDNSWVEEHLADPEIRIIDPRSTVKYLQGHLPRAVSLPVSKLFTPSLQLRPLGQLSKLFGEAGATLDGTVLVYDAYDGQNAAMMAWTLELLGHQQTLLLSNFLEGWTKEKRPLLYRPVKSDQRTFNFHPNPTIRATSTELDKPDQVKLLDLRSTEEFDKKPDDKEPGKSHMPNAINLPWTTLLGSDNKMFLPTVDLAKIFTSRGLERNDPIITYCSFGPRAAFGYLGLKQADYKNVKVYDNASQYLSGQTSSPIDENCVASTWNIEQ